MANVKRFPEADHGQVVWSQRLTTLAYGFRRSRPFELRELMLALLGLAVVAALALGPHIRHGGFYLDDWSNAAGALQPPGDPNMSDALTYFADLTIYRPVLVVYVPLTYFTFGMNIDLHLAWAATLSALAATMFYGVLRALGVPWMHAVLIAALTIVFPWSDSTRLWATADQITLSITFAAAGVLVALMGLKRNSWRLHSAAALLYLLSILTYEVTLPLIVAAGLLYCLQVGWRAARLRWLVDVVVAASAAIWVGTHTARSTSGLSDNIDHLELMVKEAGTVLGRSGLPLGPQHTTVVLFAIAVILAVGASVYLMSDGRDRSEPAWGLRNWLLLAAAGLAVAVLGWVMFIPADPYYTPSIYGMTNRVNGLAAFGLVLLLYAVIGVAGSLIGMIAPRKKNMVATGVAVVLGGVLLASYTHVLRRHIEIWNYAFSAESTALRKMKAKLPRLPEGTTVFASSYPANQTLGVPILSATWDLDGMVKMEYDDMTLSAYPVLPGLNVACRGDGVSLEGEGAPELIRSYGAVRLLNLDTGELAAPSDRQECEAVADRYVAGPLYLSTAY